MHKHGFFAGPYSAAIDDEPALAFCDIMKLPKLSTSTNLV